MDEIPEIIDPALPEPDFFDAEGDVNIPAVTQSILSSTVVEEPPLALGSLLDYVAGVEENLKYDDEQCEFNEFLVGCEDFQSNGKTDEREKEQHASLEEERSTQSSPASMLSCNNLAGEIKQSEETTKKASKKVDDSEKESTFSISEPNTPDSRGSAVIRLSMPTLPKVSIASSRKTRASPVRASKETVDKTPGKGQGTKRKLSDDEEYEPELESDGEDEGIGKRERVNKTRSGRQLRRAARFGQDETDEEDDNQDDKPKYRATKNKRNARKAARYGFEEDEKEASEDDEKVNPEGKSADLKKKHANYWTDDNGVLFFEDRNGHVISLKRLSITLARLSQADITKLTYGEDPSDDEDNPFLLEVCIDNFRSAEEAVKGGAKRIELCSSLSEGGLTPTGGFLTLVKERFNIPVFVMIRPRGGDFVYTPDEIEVMARDINHYKQMGADGFVFGVLTKDCEIDLENCRMLKQMASPLECTFHRAFDKVFDPFAALETIISLGFSRILTSGQAATAHAGIPVLKRLVESARRRVVIMAGAGVSQANVADIVRRTGVNEVHGSASKSVASTMCAPSASKSSKRGGHRPSGVKMGSTDDSFIKVTDSELVSQIARKGRKQVRLRQ